MYKDELIQLHQFLVYVLKYLDTDENAHELCEKYLVLNISPHHIHKTKAEHKHAVFVLSGIINDVILDKDPDTIPINVQNAISELVRKSEKELIAQNQGK